MSQSKEVCANISQFLRSQHFAVLATQGKRYPYCSLVTFALSPDAKGLYFFTDTRTHKYENLATFPHISLLIDNQKNSIGDIATAMAITVLGVAEERKADEKGEVISLFSEMPEPFLVFARRETTAIIHVNIETFIVVDQFEHVQKYHVKELYED